MVSERIDRQAHGIQKVFSSRMYCRRINAWIGAVLLQCHSNKEILKLTEKYTIQKAKPIQRTTLPPAHNKQPPSITQFMVKNPGENSGKYQQASSNS